MCDACIQKVTPVLNEVAGKDNWQVDTQTPDKKLIVHADESVTGEKIIAAVARAGYKAEPVS